MPALQRKKMENLLKSPDLWENLKASRLPVVLYGIGNGADKIIKVLADKGISFVGVFSSDSFVRKGKTFHGFPVLTLGALEEKYGKLTVLMCFGSSRPEVIGNVKKIKQKHILFAPDVPVYGDILFDRVFFKSTYKRHEAIYDMLTDETSKKTFKNIVNFKISGDTDYLFDCETSLENAFTDILKLGENEVYLDLGAYRGDTVLEFLKYAPAYKKIYAVEPDNKTFLKLRETTKDIRNIECINACVSNESRVGTFSMNGSRGSNNSRGNMAVAYLTADDIIKDNRVTYIKADIEGAECDFLEGAGNIIKTNKPKMMISCYHRSDDLFKIPEAVMKLRNDYKIYMRHFPSVPAWDTVYLFV